MEKRPLLETQSNIIPPEYEEVILQSKGKLATPKVLHVRNYTFKETVELSMMNEKNYHSIIHTILDSIIYENIDVGDLHIEEIIQIFITVYVAWWNPVLEGFKYLIDEKGKDEKENWGYIDIPINELRTIPLGDDVKEPFTLRLGNDKVYSLITPKLKHEIKAYNYVNDKLSEKADKFSEIKHKIRIGRNDYTLEELREYEEYEREYSIQYMMATQSQMIVAYNGNNVSSFEEGLKIFHSTDMGLWKEYNNVIDKHFKFGIAKDITFKCERTGKSITRRFQFRLLDFLPDMDAKVDTKYNLSFG